MKTVKILKCVQNTNLNGFIFHDVNCHIFYLSNSIKIENPRSLISKKFIIALLDLHGSPKNLTQAPRDVY